MMNQTEATRFQPELFSAICCIAGHDEVATKNASSAVALAIAVQGLVFNPLFESF